jgi:hypothetical protein
MIERSQPTWVRMGLEKEFPGNFDLSDSVLKTGFFDPYSTGAFDLFDRGGHIAWTLGS